MQVRTAKEASDLLTLIDKLRNSLYQTDFTQFRKILQDNAIVAGYLQIGPDSTGRDTLIAYLDRTKEELSQTPHVKLVMAINPDFAFINTMCDWFKTNIGKKVLLDITVNPSMVGGVTLTYNGFYRDYSINAKLNSYFKKFSNINDLLRA